MSEAVANQIGSLASDAAVDLAWAQWAALAPIATPSTSVRPRSMIDPEALVLLSLGVQDRERRLADVLTAWARVAASLMSVHRIKTLAATYPKSFQARVAGFGTRAANAGDKRWRRYADSDVLDAGEAVRQKELGRPRLTDPPALMLRLRAGFGVGAKADVLSYLLSLRSAAADLNVIAAATGYTPRALRTAAEEMVVARIITKVESFPTAFVAHHPDWAHVLAPDHKAPHDAIEAAIPTWYFWSGVFAFLAAVIDWERCASAEKWSSYVASTRARDLVEHYRLTLQRAQVAIPDFGQTPGAEALTLFQALVVRVRETARNRL